MSQSSAVALNEHAEEQALADKTSYGFWVYLMTDCLLFASLFATFAVLRNNTNGGPASSELINLPTVLVETIALLTSSFTCGLAMVALRRQQKQLAIGLLVVTMALGFIFLGIELNEFHHLASEGNSWHRSGFLSAFFTLVGTHGLHIASGLLWLIILFVQIAKKGLTAATTRRLTLFSMFWHFLDLIWIFIFTIVYMLGAI